MLIAIMQVVQALPVECEHWGICPQTQHTDSQKMQMLSCHFHASLLQPWLMLPFWPQPCSTVIHCAIPLKTKQSSQCSLEKRFGRHLRCFGLVRIPSKCRGSQQRWKGHQHEPGRPARPHPNFTTYAWYDPHSRDQGLTSCPMFEFESLLAQCT